MIRISGEFGFHPYLQQVENDPRKPCEVEIEVYGDKQFDSHQESLSVLKRDLLEALDAAEREYNTCAPIRLPGVTLEWNDPPDDSPSLSFTFHGTRMETETEAAARWKATEEGAREWERKEAARKESEERALLARLQTKYNKTP